jgi:hypothetical protein
LCSLVFFGIVMNFWILINRAYIWWMFFDIIFRNEGVTIR